MVEAEREMGELVEKILEMLKKNSVGFIIALFVVEGS